MPHGLQRLAVPGEPAGRPGVQPGQLVAVLDPEPVAQHLGVEPVVAVPAAAVVDREGQRAGAFLVLEDGGAVVAAGERVGQVGGEPVDDARAEQEVAGGRWLLLQHLGQQVLGDPSVVPGEGGDRGGELVGRGAALQRERGQPKARCPALGAVEQAAQVDRAEVQVVLGEQRRRLLQGEGEVGSADLGELARPAAAGAAAAAGPPW